LLSAPFESRQNSFRVVRPRNRKSERNGKTRLFRPTVKFLWGSAIECNASMANCDSEVA